MQQLLLQIKWQMLLLHRNQLINISVAVTVLYGLGFFIFKDMEKAREFLTLLIFNDPAIIGLFFVSLPIMIEKQEGVLAALFVSPVKLHHFLLARVICLSLLGWACSLGMVMTLLGLDFHFLHFSVGTFSSCAVFGLIGIVMVSYTDVFLIFILRTIPVLLLLSLPLLNIFELTDVQTFKWLPTQAGLDLIANSYADKPNSHAISWAYASIAIWLPVLYFLAYRIFKNKVVNA
ncbi:MAG: hypothetical protein AAFP19_05350 [Bacteroidota bacterium]